MFIIRRLYDRLLILFTTFNDNKKTINYKQNGMEV